MIKEAIIKLSKKQDLAYAEAVISSMVSPFKDKAVR